MPPKKKKSEPLSVLMPIKPEINQVEEYSRLIRSSNRKLLIFKTCFADLRGNSFPKMIIKNSKVRNLKLNHLFWTLQDKTTIKIQFTNTLKRIINKITDFTFCGFDNRYAKFILFHAKSLKSFRFFDAEKFLMSESKILKLSPLAFFKKIRVKLDNLSFKISTWNENIDRYIENIRRCSFSQRFIKHLHVFLLLKGNDFEEISIANASKIFPKLKSTRLILNKDKLSTSNRIIQRKFLSLENYSGNINLKWLEKVNLKKWELNSIPSNWDMINRLIKSFSNLQELIINESKEIKDFYLDLPKSIIRFEILFLHDLEDKIVSKLEYLGSKISELNRLEHFEIHITYFKKNEEYLNFYKNIQNIRGLKKFGFNHQIKSEQSQDFEALCKFIGFQSTLEKLDINLGTYESKAFLNQKFWSLLQNTIAQIQTITHLKFGIGSTNGVNKDGDAIPFFIRKLSKLNILELDFNGQGLLNDISIPNFMKEIATSSSLKTFKVKAPLSKIELKLLTQFIKFLINHNNFGEYALYDSEISHTEITQNFFGHNFARKYSDTELIKDFLKRRERF